MAIVVKQLLDLASVRKLQSRLLLSNMKKESLTSVFSYVQFLISQIFDVFILLFNIYLF